MESTTNQPDTQLDSNRRAGLLRPAPSVTTRAAVRIRRATGADGPDIHRLVGRCAGLDPNSPYAYALLCDEFGDSCVVARDGNDHLVGFVTGFVSPRDPDRLFLWQVGVDPDHRGRGMAHALLHAFVNVARTDETTVLETTITPDNRGSLALFASFAQSQGSRLERVGTYPGAWLGEGHADEDRYRIVLRPGGE